LTGRIEDYAIVGDMQSAALICTDGSVDWLCLPRFDSEACFCALLGTPDHGRWRIAPADCADGGADGSAATATPATPGSTSVEPGHIAMSGGACQADMPGPSVVSQLHPVRR